MDQPAGFQRDYGHNPYRGYDTSDWPFRYKGKMPHHGISPLVWVVRVGDRAWPLTRVAVLGALSGAGVVISWTARQALALDTSRIASGRDVGTIRVRDNQGWDVPQDAMFALAFHSFWPEGRWIIGS